MHRPDVVGEAAHPQRVEFQPRRFEHAQHLDRRIRRLGLEERVRAQPPQLAERAAEAHVRRDALELRELRERFVELGARLELVGVQAALARESHRRERIREEAPPVVRRALARAAA